MMIDITLLGSAGLVPLAYRALTAALLACSGRKILFDCGEGTQIAARRKGLDLLDVDLIALTHYHGDHTFGLPGLMLTMASIGRREPLYITGPRGLEEAVDPFLRLADWATFEIKLFDLMPEGLRLSEWFQGWPKGAKLTAFKTEHRVSSQGYLFSLDQEKDSLIESQKSQEQIQRSLRFVFSGDTMACDSLIEASRDADLVIYDATYGRNDQAQTAIDHGHMNFAQAAETAHKAGAKRLWLAHYAQTIKNPEDDLPNARAIFENTECGVDGLTRSLSFETEAFSGLSAETSGDFGNVGSLGNLSGTYTRG